MFGSLHKPLSETTLVQKKNGGTLKLWTVENVKNNFDNLTANRDWLFPEEKIESKAVFISDGVKKLTAFLKFYGQLTFRAFWKIENCGFTFFLLFYLMLIKAFDSEMC